MTKQNNNYSSEQIGICKKYETKFLPPDANTKVGIALNVKTGLLPLNGLRHPIEGNSNGWYIWAGEVFSYSDDFFVPVHVEHLADWCLEVLRFLALPPGWRFLTDGSYDDVWYDASLLNI